ncbi:MAG: TonB-dependent receptor [Marinilabiliaceae bacterium]|nr:TonB-dependent receptor [Marinilabiliaceae bacterium]
MDLRFFDGRLNLDATYYKSNTYNQILPSQPLAISTGYSSQLVNAGNVQNKGIELALSTTPVRSNNFTWQCNFLYAKNKSLVVDLGDLGDSPIVIGSCELGRTVAKAGQPFGMIQGRELLRNSDGVIVVQESGRPISTNGYVDLAKVEPDWTGTVRNDLSYKGLSLGVQLDVSVGGNILAEINPWLDEQGHSVKSLIGREGWMASEAAREAAGYPSDWLPTGGVDIFVGNSVIRDASLDNAEGIQVGGVLNEGENARYADPRKIWDDFLGRKGGAAEYNIEDASFVKLREVSLSYTLPTAIIAKTPLQSIQISVVGRNLWLIHRNTTHFDPDQYQQNNTTGSIGIANRLWPSTRSVGFNLNLKF